MRSQGDKPQEVLDLHPLTARVFEVVQDEFAVPPMYPLTLSHVDHLAEREATATELAAEALRHLQVIRQYAAPGSALDNDHFIGVLVVLVPALDELAARSVEHRGLLLLARDRAYEAAWALIRDSGGPGLFGPT